MNITETERKALQGILDSNFQDGPGEVGKWVWTWSANPFKTKRTFSGAVASLVKKGLADVCDEGDDAVICITQAGMDALNGVSISASYSNPE